MNRLRYELRGLAYWLECANPFRNTVTARHLPLGLRLQGYKRDAVGRGLYRRGVHEPGPTKWLLDHFANSSGATFLDVGANIGYFSCLFAKLAGPNGKIVSIEPEPLNHSLLEKNLRDNLLLDRVTLHPCAVGAGSGTARLGIYKPANRGRHSMVDLQPSQDTIEVPVHRLDDLLRNCGVSSWSLMKVDVEGFEPYVFQGATETLSRTEVLLMEYSPAHWKKAGFEPTRVFELLSGNFSRIDHFTGLQLLPTTAAECARSETIQDLLLHR